jgi:hypothetical protein
MEGNRNLWYFLNEEDSAVVLHDPAFYTTLNKGRNSVNQNVKSFAKPKRVLFFASCPLTYDSANTFFE